MMPNKELLGARTMPTNAKPAVVIRDLETVGDLRKVEAVEKEVWGLSDQDTMPLTMIIASRAAGSVWVGAFDRCALVGFAFGFLGRENGESIIDSRLVA